MTNFNPLENCSKHFKYIDFINCGETQNKTQLINSPKDPRTISAIKEMATTILDTVVYQFGEIKRTYGFCSNELLKQIKKHPKPCIAPQLDQHAGYEVNSKTHQYVNVKDLLATFMPLTLTHYYWLNGLLNTYNLIVSIFMVKIDQTILASGQKIREQLHY